MARFTFQPGSLRTALAVIVGAISCVGLLTPVPASPPAHKPKDAPARSFETSAAPIARKYCVSCHFGGDPAGGINLASDKTTTAMLARAKIWGQAAEMVDNQRMPPIGSPSPTAAERAAFVDYLQSTISSAACLENDPGRVTMRRLNRVEYNNTVRDLTGVDFSPADEFPSDEVGYGFDNIADVQSLSSLQMENYMAAARRVAHAAIFAPEDKASRERKSVYTGSQLDGDGTVLAARDRILYSPGATGITYNFPVRGRYRLTAAAFEDRAGPEHARMTFRLGDDVLGTATVVATAAENLIYFFDLDLPAGSKRFSVSFDNDYYDVTNPNLSLRGDRNLHIRTLEIQRLDAADSVSGPNSFAGRFLTVRPAADTELARDAATRRDIAEFAFRAFRRPPSAAELDRLCGIASLARSGGGSFEHGMQVAVQAVLASPNFLFRIERDPEPNNPRSKHALSDFALATRLSYFLTSSTPDDTLLRLAAAGKLHDPTNLLAQTHRLLNDPRSVQSLADNFAAQWLQLRKLQNATPDPAHFPEWNEGMRDAMRKETTMYFQNVITQDSSVTDLLDSDYTFVNASLAKFYGISGVEGDQFRRVQLTGGQRGGVLTQASVLTVTSNPTRTSPVKRGKWVMENLLGVEIPPAPPGVPQLADDKNEAIVGTLRQRMERHRSDPACASCHAQMDPIGFGLENYDAIGKWRTVDDGAPILARGALPGGGAKFDGPQALRVALRGRSAQFVHCFTEKLLIYALGRGIEDYDRCHIDTIVHQAAKKDYRFSALIDAIVLSDPFRNRRGDST